MKKVFVFKLCDEGSDKVAEFDTQEEANTFISEQEVKLDYYFVNFDLI